MPRKEGTKKGSSGGNASLGHRQMNIFSHLQEIDGEPEFIQTLGFGMPAHETMYPNVKPAAPGLETEKIHPAAIRFAVQDGHHVYHGCTSRLRAFLKAFDAILQDMKAVHSKEGDTTMWFERVTAELNRVVEFVQLGRALPLPVLNFVRQMTQKIQNMGEEMKIDDTISDSDAYDRLSRYMAEFNDQRVDMARSLIADRLDRLIDADDEILTFGYSGVVTMGLIKAANKGLRFRVTVADSGPAFQGKVLLRKLLEAGVPCTYCLVNAVPTAIQRATKVWLGVHTYMSNGVLLGKLGTSLVAGLAYQAHKPVLAICETFKFCDAVQIDAVTNNELGAHQDMLREDSPLNGMPHKIAQNVRMLNLAYDITPIKHVSVMVTELGLNPPSAVPAVIREFTRDTMQ